jgi:hypothetical protein
LCDKAYNFKLQVKSATFDVESGAATIPLGTLRAEDLLFTNSPVSTSTRTGEINRIEIDFSHSSLIRKDSVLYIKLNDRISYLSGSTCTVSGTEPTSTCAMSAIPGTLKVSRAFESSQRPPGAPIKIILQGVENPRAVGSYSLNISVASVDDCVYMKGTNNLIIDQVTTILQASFTPRNPFRNIFDGYTFTIKPSSTTSIKSGDYFYIQLPSTMMVSETPSCQKLTANLITMTCSRVGKDVLKAEFTVDLANYALNKELSFSSNFIMNPDTEGTSTGIDIFLKESSGGTYQQLKNVVFNFQGISTANPSEVSFSSDLKGKLSEVMLTIKPAHYIEPGSSIVVQYSDKFDLEDSSLVSSSPNVLNSPTTNKVSRQVKLPVRNAIQPDTSLKFTILANNPGADSISTSDLTLLVYNPLDKLAFTSPPLTQQKTFKCDPVCLSCSRLHSICTKCISGLYLHADGKCQGSPATSFKIGKEVPFIFLCLAFLIIVGVLIFGGLFKMRNYNFNFIYFLLRFNFTVALVFFLVFCFLNPTVQPFLWIILIIAISVHVLLSVLGRHIMSQMTDFVTEEASFKWCRGKGVSPKQVQLKSKRISLLQTYHTLSLFFSSAVLRYFYSNSLGNKGFFWYYEPNKFIRIKAMLFRLGLVYIVAIPLPLLVVSIVYFTQIEFFAFLLELFALSCIDVIAFWMAILELYKSDTEIKEFRGYLDKANKTEVDGILSNPMDDSGKDPSGMQDPESDPAWKWVNPNRETLLGAKKIGEGKYVLPDGKEIEEKEYKRMEKEKALNPFYGLLKGIKRKEGGGLVDAQGKGVTDEEYESFKEGVKPNPYRKVLDGIKRGKDGLLRDADGRVVAEEDYQRMLQGLSPLKGASVKDIQVDLPHPHDSSNLFSRNTTERKYLDMMKRDGEAAGDEQTFFLEETMMGDTREIRGGKHLNPGYPDYGRKKNVLNKTREDPEDSMASHLQKKKRTRELTKLEKAIRRKSAQFTIGTGGVVKLKNDASPLVSNRREYKPDAETNHALNETTGNTRPAEPSIQVITDKSKDIVFRSKRVELKRIGSIRPPKVSRFMDNMICDKWLLNTSKDYVELLYQEEGSGEAPKLQENLEYDHPELEQEDRTLNVLSKLQPIQPDSQVQTLEETIYKTMKPEEKKVIAKDMVNMMNNQQMKREELISQLKKIDIGDLPQFENMIETRDEIKLDEEGNLKVLNGQKVENLKAGIIQDSKNNRIDLNKQKPEMIQKGIFVDEKGNKIKLNKQDPNDVMKGIIRDNEGNEFKLADQKFDEMSRGVLYDPQGKIHSINGQTPALILERRVVEDSAEVKLDLNKQTFKDLEKGRLKTTDGKTITVAPGQNLKLLELGLLKGYDGQVYRLKDQDLNMIQTDKNYTDVDNNIVHKDGKVTISPENIRHEQKLIQEALKCLPPSQAKSLKKEIEEAKYVPGVSKVTFKDAGITDKEGNKIFIPSIHPAAESKEAQGKHFLKELTSFESKLVPKRAKEDEDDENEMLNRELNGPISSRRNLQKNNNPANEILGSRESQPQSRGSLKNGSNLGINKNRKNRFDDFGSKHTMLESIKEGGSLDGPTEPRMEKYIPGRYPVNQKIDPETLVINLIADKDESFDLDLKVVACEEGMMGATIKTETGQRKGNPHQSRFNDPSQMFINDFNSGIGSTTPKSRMAKIGFNNLDKREYPII